MKTTKKQFKTNLGMTDAKAFGLDHKQCTAGAVVELTEDQLKAVEAKYPLILTEPEDATVKAVAKPAEITAPAKHDKH